MCGAWLREYKNTHEVVILDRGEVQGKYKYPKDLKISFESQMVNWYNLFLCGEYQIIEEDNCFIHISHRIVESVINGVKPIGFVLVERMSMMDYYVGLLTTAGIDFDIKFYPLKEAISGHTYEGDIRGYFILGMSSKGKIGETFDLEKYAETYRDFAKITGIDIEEGLEFVLSRANMELTDLIKNVGDGYGYDYSRPSNIGELMFTGLTLGYPLESTIALILENKYR